MVSLTTEECRALTEIIDQLLGPAQAFAWDGSDSLDSAFISSCAKVYREAGRKVPDNLVSTTCPDCKGKGLVAAPNGDIARWWPCDSCGMTGKINK